MTQYLNQAAVQNALGVNLNWTMTNYGVYYDFQQSGDFVYPTSLLALEDLLNKGVRVAMYYGDADYSCNWFGGEAISLAVNYTNAAKFQKAGYAPFEIDGTEYGAVRQYGNFSFLRVYNAAHEVAYSQRMILFFPISSKLNISS
jgi:carboxypeptidase C (cathepsin A)